jgi:hypothetical protein
MVVLIEPDIQKKMPTAERQFGEFEGMKILSLLLTYRLSI